jgi:hypothetical protein
MNRSIYFIGMIFFTLIPCLLSCTSTSSKDQKILDTSESQSTGDYIFDSCDVYVTTAIPQLLIGKNMTSEQMRLLIALAINSGDILENGKVIDRIAVTDLALMALGRMEIAISFDSIPISVPKENETPVCYILEILDDNSKSKHFVLAGIDKVPLYNPCNIKGSILSSIEVFVFTRDWITN